MKNPNRHSRITLRDIAQAVGVSHVTVSMALRNSPRISAEVRARIQKQAQDMDYRPDPMLSALANYRRSRSGPRSTHSVIAWINTWALPRQLRMLQEFDAYWTGASACAERFGYRLEEFIINHQLSPDRLEKILLTRGIRGILLPPQQTPIQWHNFDWAHFAAVRFGQSVQAPKVHSVESDQAGNVVLALQTMREKGYDRIGLVVGKTHQTAFVGGHAIAMQRSLVPVQIPPLLLAHKSSACDRREVVSWIQEHHPQAILTEEANLQQLLASEGYPVPEEIALAGLSKLDVHAEAGIDQNPQEIGRVAVLSAISLIQENAYGIPPIARRILIGGTWVEGASLPDRRDRSCSRENTTN